MIKKLLQRLWLWLTINTHTKNQPTPNSAHNKHYYEQFITQSDIPRIASRSSTQKPTKRKPTSPIKRNQHMRFYQITHTATYITVTPH